jgi:hypothetical protein
MKYNATANLTAPMKAQKKTTRLFSVAAIFLFSKSMSATFSLSEPKPSIFAQPAEASNPQRFPCPNSEPISYS